MIKINKTCDQCRHRKIRCIVTDNTPGKRPTCVYCEKRNEPCHFSVFRRRTAPKVTKPYPSIVPQLSQPLRLDDGELFIDRILQQGSQELPNGNVGDHCIIKINEEQSSTSNLAFFSDQKIRSLCEKIGSMRLQSLVERLEEVIVVRMRGTQDSPWDPIGFSKPSIAVGISADESRRFIDSYFKNLHPVYPFLDREEFEQKMADPNLPRVLEANKAFSALYHAVLALGAQYYHGASFQPGSSRTWDIFAIALGYLPELIIPGSTLEHVQAVLAMAIFSLNASCLQLEDSLIWEATRMALMNWAHKGNSNAKAARVFWVVYILEKSLSVSTHMGSIIADEDVGCAIPNTPESTFGTFNSLLSSVRCARISSIAFSKLFSVSAPLASVEARLNAVDSIRRLVEDWRQWVPPTFRPGETPRLSDFPEHSSKLVLLHTHFWYYSFVITLERLSLHLDKDGPRCQQSRQNLMKAARSIADMTRFIELDSHMPLFILAVSPLSAVFILFEFVIHNPRHHETRSNLVALDSLAGYFSLVEYASKGALVPAGSMIAEFADIAREYYCKVQQTVTESNVAKRKMQKQPSTQPGDPQPGTATLSQIGESSDYLSTNSTIEPRLGSRAASAPLSEYGSSNPDHLIYPTPHNFGAATDIQMFDSSDFNKSLFGWMAPDWTEGDFDFGAINLNSEGQPPSSKGNPQ